MRIFLFNTLPDVRGKKVLLKTLRKKGEKKTLPKEMEYYAENNNKAIFRASLLTALNSGIIVEPLGKDMTNDRDKMYHGIHSKGFLTTWVLKGFFSEITKYIISTRRVF